VVICLRPYFKTTGLSLAGKASPAALAVASDSIRALLESAVSG